MFSRYAEVDCYQGKEGVLNHQEAARLHELMAINVS
jgi:hypothetical protein